MPVDRCSHVILVATALHGILLDICASGDRRKCTSGLCSQASNKVEKEKKRNRKMEKKNNGKKHNNKKVVQIQIPHLRFARS